MIKYQSKSTIQPTASSPEAAEPSADNPARSASYRASNGACDKNMTTTLEPKHDLEDQEKPSSPIESRLDWTLKILGFILAILFGIWAPISYKATADGNSDNNASQEQLTNALSDLQNHVSSQADAVSSLQANIAAIGALRVWEFCQGAGGKLASCQDVTATMTIDSYITSLANPATATATSTATIPSSSGAGASSSISNSDKLVLGLGIGIGLPIFLLACFGLFSTVRSMKEKGNTRHW